MSKEYYQEEQSEVCDEALGRVAILARRVLDTQADVAVKDQALKDAKKRLRNLEENELPALMDEIGIEKFSMDDGSSINVKEDMYASIPTKNKAAAAQWLFDNGQGSLVKMDVVTHFEKGQEEKVQEVTDLLAELGYSFNKTQTVNTASVKAVLKELIAQGQDVPLKLFGAYILRRAIVKTN